MNTLLHILNLHKGPEVGQLKPNEYQCAMCRGVFEYGWSDDKATTELANNFPGFEKDDCAVICDDCYQGTGLFCGPPEDPFKDIPEPMREIFRHKFDEVKKKVQTAFENHILYGTPLNPEELSKLVHFISDEMPGVVGGILSNQPDE